MEELYLLFFDDGGPPKPGDRASILQWLSSYEGGLVPFVDKVDPRLVDSPELVGVPCIAFDGTDGQEVETPVPSDVFGASGLVCYSATFNPSAVADTDLGAYRIVTFRSSESSRASLSIDNSKIGVQNVLSMYGQVAISTDTWYQAVVVVNPTASAFKLYLNGVLASSGSGTFAPVGSETIRIGGGAAPIPDRVFEGLLSNVTLYDRELTPTEVADLYAGSNIGVDRTFEYTMGDNDGTVVGDISGNGNDGTLSGGATWGTADGIDDHSLLYGYTDDGARQTPALRDKTKSVATFDGVADKLTKAGIVGTDNYTVNGTAVPTAGTGEITFTAGTVEQLLLDGVVVADFTDQLGKSVSEVDGYTISTGAGGLDAVWAVRPADAGGVYVDSDYNLLGVYGSTISPCIHNLCASGHKETDADYTIFEGENLMGNGVDTWNEIYIADYIAHANGTDMVWLQWEEVNGNKVVKERLAYPADYAMTPTVYQQTLRWSERYTTPPAGALVPAEVTAGTGIGPNGEWADNGAGTVLLVEDV